VPNIKIPKLADRAPSNTQSEFRRCTQLFQFKVVPALKHCAIDKRYALRTNESRGTTCKGNISVRPDQRNDCVCNRELQRSSVQWYSSRLPYNRDEAVTTGNAYC
jgi:hypothetical protein